MELSQSDVKALEAILHRDAVALLAASAGTESPEYKENRELFVRVWDALYDR